MNWLVKLLVSIGMGFGIAMLPASSFANEWGKYAFELQNIDDQTVSSQTLQADLTLVSFWATWCTPCVASFPKVESLYQTYKDSPEVDVISVHVGTDYGPAKTLKAYADYKQLSFPILKDENGKYTKKFNRFPFITPIPKYILIDKNGDIVRRYSKLSPQSLADIRKVCRIKN